MEDKYKVCPRCDGEGLIVNPALSVWTSADIAEDPEGFNDMRAGQYDVPCDLCHGERVVLKDGSQEEAWRERREDARIMAYESMDVETILDGSYYTP